MWAEGKIERDPRAAWARDVARATNTPFLDLNDIIATKYEALGPEAVHAFFPIDHTHTSETGARFSAEAVVSGLKADRSPLAAYLRDAGKQEKQHFKAEATSIEKSAYFAFGGRTRADRTAVRKLGEVDEAGVSRPRPRDR